MLNSPMIMTAGPTQISSEVRNALSRETTNPDLDESFFEFYKETCDKIKKLLNTREEVLILDGEGILGLEAACASLTETGDRVLCIDNGIFGRGFKDFSTMYGASVTTFKSDYRRGVDLDKLKDFLKNDNDFKYATLVHCETPSGILNPIKEICTLLKSYGILTVIDAVSSIGGEEIRVDEWNMDITLGGSQKCLSAPPGLTFLSISKDARETMKKRKSPVVGFYSNLNIWDGWYEKKWFPYTQPINSIVALNCALDRILNTNSLLRHKTLGYAIREAVKNSGLELYGLDSYSNTVTTICLPYGASFKDVFEKMLNEHNIMIGGAFDYLEGKVIRIGNMGENCHRDKIYNTLKALDSVLRSVGVELLTPIYEEFERLVENN